MPVTQSVDELSVFSEILPSEFICLCVFLLLFVCAENRTVICGDVIHPFTHIEWIRFADARVHTPHEPNDKKKTSAN